MGSPDAYELVLDLLDSWSGPLTWNRLIAKVKSETGHEYSRFTFADYPRIADAFTLKKKAISGTLAKPPSSPRDVQVQAALAQAARLRAKAERLERENALLKEQFFIWARNADRHGLTEEQLYAMPPMSPRERSKIS